MTNNTNENTSDSNTELSFVPERREYKMEEIYQGVVMHPNGYFYTIHKKDMTNVFLSLIEGDQIVPAPAALILHSINTGRCNFYPPGDESYKSILYNEEVSAYKNNILKSLIFNQLALEANDALIDTVEHDKYLKNLLLKANKGLELKAKKHLERVYGANPEMLINIFNSIDRFVGRLATKLPHEFFYLNSIVEEYEEDPAKYIGRQVNLEKLQ